MRKKTVKPRSKLYFERGDKFWQVEVTGKRITTTEGKKGEPGKEKIVAPKSALGKENPSWEALTLTWKKIKAGYGYVAKKKGALRLQIPSPEHLKDETFDVFPDGKTAAIVQDSDNCGSRVHLIDLETGLCRKVLDHTAFMIRSLRCHPDGNQIFVTPDKSEGWDIYVVACNGGKPKRLSYGAARYNCPLDIDAKGTRLLHASGASSLKVTDLKSGNVLYELKVPDTMHGMGPVTTLSRSGTRLLVAYQPENPDSPNVVETHDLKSGKVARAEMQNTPVDDIIWIGKRFVLNERFAPPTIWEQKRGKIVPVAIKINARGTRLAASENERYFAVYECGRLTIAESASGKIVVEAHEPLHLKVGNVRFATSGRIVISGGGVLSVIDTGLETE